MKTSLSVGFLRYMRRNTFEAALGFGLIFHLPYGVPTFRRVVRFADRLHPTYEHERPQE